MSDEELFEKQAELGRRLSWAARFSANGEAVDQLMRMSSAIETVRRDRAFLASYAFQESLYPEVTETDPDLRDLQRGAPTPATGPSRNLKSTAGSRPRPFAAKTRPAVEIPTATTKPVTTLPAEPPATPAVPPPNGN